MTVVGALAAHPAGLARAVHIPPGQAYDLLVRAAGLRAVSSPARRDYVGHAVEVQDVTGTAP